VGRSVGKQVVGTWDGSSVVDVGFPVGFRVGSNVGKKVGIIVGVRVEQVGVTVGENVAGVGPKLGRELGASVDGKHVGCREEVVGNVEGIMAKVGNVDGGPTVGSSVVDWTEGGRVSVELGFTDAVPLGVNADCDGHSAGK